MLRKTFSFLICILIFSSGAVFSDENEQKGKCPSKPDCLEEKIETTRHEVKINGRPIKYTATAGTMILKNREGDDQASIFYIAYTKDNEKEHSKRPITFCFNGGPGSSSVWLHMGTFGPKRVAMSVDGTPETPYHLIDNEYSLLDITDLVFIDPVSTGYSRTAPSVDPGKFHGVDEDIKSVGEFIRLYTTRNGRWTSPKFVAGESYGTTRATGLANHLYEETRMELNGIVLISAILDFQAYFFSMGNDLPYITFLPTYSSIAWYHKRLDKELLQDFFKTQKEVEEFALGEYANALMQGNNLSDERKKQIASKLAKYTGLDEDYILRSNLRVDICQFAKMLMNGDNRIVSRFDGRFLGVDQNPTSSRISYDPTFALIAPAFTSTINQYLRDDLNWEEDREYEILSRVHQSWDWSRAKNQYLNMNSDLLELMTQNPRFRVFVGSGYYDLATPFGATDYTFAHLPIDPILSQNITLKYYDAGHMMYIHKPSLAKLKKDIADFLNEALD
jgi:carboxypeptidase C (cathepsin A)